MTSLRFSVAVGGLAALLAASVGTAAAVAAPAHTLHGVHVHVTSKRLVAGPHHTAPGITHLVNTGIIPVFVLEPKGHAGTDTLAADLKRADTKAGPAKLFHDFRILDELNGHAGDYVRLCRGPVYLADVELAHPTAAKIATLTVAGPARNATLPRSSRVTIDRQRGLHAESMMPHHGYLHLYNRSNRLVVLLVVNVGKDVTTATLRHFVNHPSIDDLFDVSPGFTFSFTGLMPPTSSVYQYQRSPKGRSVLVTVPLTTRNSFALHKAGVRGVLFS